MLLLAADRGIVEIDPEGDFVTLADAFGHIGQLPQILGGFGIDSAVFWRGLGDEGEELGNEFWWQAPDGSCVLAIHLREGYGNVAKMGYPIPWGDPSGMEFDLDRALLRLRHQGLCCFVQSPARFATHP